MKKTLAALVLALALGGAGARALASDRPAEAPLGDESGAPAGHAAAKGGEHHWSLSDYFIPMTLVEFVRTNAGKSVIDHQEITDLHHVGFGVIVFVLILLMAFFAFRRSMADRETVLPDSGFGALAFFQVLSDAMLGLMEGLLGREKALKFLPLIGSLGMFILVSNLLGLIPGFLPPTDNLNTTLPLGIIVFLVTQYHGIRTHGFGYVKHFLGPIIKWYAIPLMLLMLVIEVISHIARPISLGIRLLGNIAGDHAVVAAFAAMAIPLVPVPFIVLGLFVSVVQALVFCMLSTIYIAMATQHEEEGAEKHH
jgi:F-type H+-transporting ATPase subunit a